MTSHYDVGFIGGGMISQIAHLPFYSEDSRINIKRLAETRPSLKPHLQKTFNIENICDDYYEVINDPDIKTVIIIAPRQATGPLVLKALQAGKNVITEKPMAHTSEQVEKQLLAVSGHNQYLHVGYMKRYDPGIIHAKHLFESLKLSNELGELLHCNFYNHAKRYAWDIPPHKRPDESRLIRFETWDTSPSWLPSHLSEAFGTHINAGIHDINLIKFFFDDEITVNFSQLAKSNSLISVLNTKNTQINYNFINAELGRWVQGGEFIFEKGCLSFKVPSPMNKHKITEVDITSNDNYRLALSEKLLPIIWSFEAQAEHFINCILTNRPSLTCGKKSIEDHRLIEDIWRNIPS